MRRDTTGLSGPELGKAALAISCMLSAPHPDESTAAGLLQQLISCAAFRSGIEGILTDAEEIRRVASSSQNHPNEFRKIPLLVGVNSEKLTLHRWCTPQEKSKPDPHNHRWNFSSVVLAGAIESQVFTVDKMVGDDTHTEFEYASSGGSQFYKLSKLGNVHLRPHSKSSYEAVTSYSQLGCDVHDARAVRTGTVSLVLRGSPIAKRCRVYRQENALESDESAVDRPSAEVVKSDLEYLHHLLGSL